MSKSMNSNGEKILQKLCIGRGNLNFLMWVIVQQKFYGWLSSDAVRSSTDEYMGTEFFDSHHFIHIELTKKWTT